MYMVYWTRSVNSLSIGLQSPGLPQRDTIPCIFYFIAYIGAASYTQVSLCLCILALAMPVCRFSWKEKRACIQWFVWSNYWVGLPVAGGPLSREKLRQRKTLLREKPSHGEGAQKSCQGKHPVKENNPSGRNAPYPKHIGGRISIALIAGSGFPGPALARFFLISLLEQGQMPTMGVEYFRKKPCFVPLAPAFIPLRFVHPHDCVVLFREHTGAQSFHGACSMGHHEILKGALSSCSGNAGLWAWWILYAVNVWKFLCEAFRV